MRTNCNMGDLERLAKQLASISRQQPDSIRTACFLNALSQDSPQRARSATSQKMNREIVQAGASVKTPGGKNKKKDRPKMNYCVSKLVNRKLRRQIKTAKQYALTTRTDSRKLDQKIKGEKQTCRLIFLAPSSFGPIVSWRSRLLAQSHFAPCFEPPTCHAPITAISDAISVDNRRGSKNLLPAIPSNSARVLPSR